MHVVQLETKETQVLELLVLIVEEWIHGHGTDDGLVVDAIQILLGDIADLRIGERGRQVLCRT